MSYYRYHLFFCTNKRAEGAERPSCGYCDSGRLRGYVKSRLKELGLAGAGGARANTAGCLDRCEEGPCLVVYPEGVWYTYIDEADLDEIIQSHLVEGRPVERLMLPPEPPESD
ncbi:MAG: (2Fe-2S) ferredoxin domain-containing protein [Gammaproteobacteria bacterium]|nr:(2Fe-2S) ferredoxin domain-containing protein [Gammaproteobacteria bacterium]